MSKTPASRNSRRRAAIASAIEAAPGPLSAGEILVRVRRQYPRLGIATVYRAVRALYRAGRISPVLLSSGETRYETAGMPHHHHFRCRKCQAVFGMDGCPVRLPRDGALPGGFLVEAHELTLVGLCPDCAPAT